MNAMTQNWVRVGTLEDIPLRGARCVKNGDMTIAIFRTADSKVFAIEDKCPHKNGPLSQGIVHDGCVTCPLHNWVISLETGRAQGADDGATRTFPVKVEESTIFIGLGSGA
jgi:nitrite reductase (NADH) small subunit